MRKGEALEKAGEVYEALELEILHLEKLKEGPGLSLNFKSRVAGMIQRVRDGRTDLSDIVMKSLGKRLPAESRELLEGIIKKAEFLLETSNGMRELAEQGSQKS